MTTKRSTAARRGASRSKSSRSGTGRGRAPAKRSRSAESVWDTTFFADHSADLWAIALATVGVLLALALYGDAAGAFGAAVNRGLGAVIGWIRYLVPPVGVATAVSPLYPNPLTASAYLTGSALSPTLTLVFPASFPLTLVGNVTLTTRQASFTGLPDIPLTRLSLALNGGPDSLFLTNCAPGSGTATGTSTDQNGDKTVAATVRYQISGCAASSNPTHNGTTNGAPTLSTPIAAGLKTGHPSLSFRISVRKKAPKLTALTVKLPRGLSFVRHRVGKRLKVTGVAVKGAKVKSLAITHGRLVIKLGKPATALRVKLTSMLKESPALVAKARAGNVGRLRLTVIALNTKHKRHAVSKLIKIANS